MAKFTPGPTVAAVSGSIGGTVYSRNRYGAYMRFRAIPITSTSPDALAAKSRMSTYSAAWAALTAAQRLAWIAYAQTHPQTDALGFSQILTGHVVFVGINTRLAHASQTAIDIPPLQTDPNGLVTLSATFDIGLGDFLLAFTETPVGTDNLIIVRACVVSSPAIKYVENYLRVVGFSAKDQATAYDTQTLIEAKFGALVAGNVVHIDVRVLDTLTGLVSIPMKVSGIVVET